MGADDGVVLSRRGGGPLEQQLPGGNAGPTRDQLSVRHECQHRVDRSEDRDLEPVCCRMVKRGRRCPPVRAMLRQQCPQADSHQVVRGEGRHPLRHHHPVIAHEQRIVSGRAPNGVWVGRPCCAPRGRWGQTWHPDASRPCLPLPSPRRDAVGLVPQRGDAARSRDRRIALPPAPQGRHHRQGLAAARAHSRRRAAGAGQRRYPNAAPTDEVGPVPVAVRRPRRVSRDSPQLLMATTGDRIWVRKRQLSWTRAQSFAVGGKSI